MVQTLKNDRPKLGIRSGASRKLLERKAMEKAPEEMTADGIEQSFPAPQDDVVAGNANAVVAPAEDGQSATVVPGSALPPAQSEDAQEAVAEQLEAIAVTPLPPAAALPAWSPEDETQFQTLLARRKAVGGRRGRNVSDQRVCVGAIKPNPNTVVAVIAGLISERGGVLSRDDLVTAMAFATFPHPKAQPKDRGWCQGYVAGAIRNGFLALAIEADQAQAA